MPLQSECNPFQWKVYFLLGNAMDLNKSLGSYHVLVFELETASGQLWPCNKSRCAGHPLVSILAST